MASRNSAAVDSSFIIIIIGFRGLVPQRGTDAARHWSGAWALASGSKVCRRLSFFFPSLGETAFCTKVGGVLLGLAEDGSVYAFCCHLRVPAQYYFSFSLSNFVSHRPAVSLQVERK